MDSTKLILHPIPWSSMLTRYVTLVKLPRHLRNSCDGPVVGGTASATVNHRLLRYSSSLKESTKAVNDLAMSSMPGYSRLHVDSSPSSAYVSQPSS